MTVKLNRIAVGAGVFAAGMVFAAWLPSATAQHSGDVSGSEGSLLPFESQITRISIPMRRDSSGHWRGRVVFDDGRAQDADEDGARGPEAFDDCGVAVGHA